MLESFGFTTHEESIYLLLTEKGNCTAGIISKETQINRRTTYDALQRLTDKGFVGTSLKNGKHIFFAMHPQTFAEKAKEVTDSANKIIPQLISLGNTKQKEAVGVALFSGKRGIKHVLDRILATKEYFSIGSSDEWQKSMPVEFEYFQNRKKETGVKGKTILGSKLINSKLAHDIAPQTTVKYFDEQEPSPVSIFIYENEVTLLMFTKQPHAIIITGSDIVLAYKSYFDALWKKGKTN